MFHGMKFQAVVKFSVRNDFILSSDQDKKADI